MKQFVQDPKLSRRIFLESHLGLGGLALMDLLTTNIFAAGKSENYLTLKPAHIPAKAKHCIFLFMEGGVSQVDTFEYKPMLQKYAGQQIPAVKGTVGEIATFSAAPNRVIPSPFSFAQHGQSGRWMCELLPHLATCVDDMAFIHGIELENNNHSQAIRQVMTGSMLPGGASVGAWFTYGLGSENQNLPGLIVLAEGLPRSVGPADMWGSGFLPAALQGTLFRNSTTPIVDLKPRPGVTPEKQRAQLDLLNWLNEKHVGERTNTSELEARIAAYEVAFRMQTEAPELVDLSSESDSTKKLYGLDNPVTQSYGRQCLLARRMVERGVRFVMALHGRTTGWDHHGNIKGNMPINCNQVDQPIAGLLKDLKSRGLLDETLVVWASEMGRTPFENNLVTEKPGRDHNRYGLVMWMAGGGVRGGATFGQTDEFGLRAADSAVLMRDVHATLLRLMGLDQNRLSYLHAGRFKKLTDIGGRVIDEILA
ncbi:MAG: DUF1501 domain-containing protein [Acidobacteria bacterium]|nr:DUF1501 domain-containing protein [Acidobacteriota bacterium]